MIDLILTQPGVLRNLSHSLQVLMYLRFLILLQRSLVYLNFFLLIHFDIALAGNLHIIRKGRWLILLFLRYY